MALHGRRSTPGPWHQAWVQLSRTDGSFADESSGIVPFRQECWADRDGHAPALLSRDKPSLALVHAPTNSRQIQHWTLNLPVRLGEHAAGRGARLMQVVAEQHIGWQVTRLWVGSRGRERSLKRQGGAARRCPLCRLAAAGAAVPATDQAVLDALELGGRPAGLLTSSALTVLHAPTGPADLPAPAAA
jgi:hypothetical protein